MLDEAWELLIFALPFTPIPAYGASVLRSRIIVPASFLLFSAICGVFPASAEETAPVERVIVNRIVAVVDQEVITLVELKRRAEPFMKRLAEVPADKRAAAEAQLYRDLVNGAIDEHLMARDARALRISTTNVEIDAALEAIAKAKGVSREKLKDLVAEQGFTEQQYREQLVRQLLLGKLIRIRMAEQLKALDKDPEKSSKQLERAEKIYLLKLRANVFIEVRL